MAVTTEAQDRACRICLCGEEEEQLVRPCACRGTIEWVHGSCLQEWLENRQTESLRCELCLAKYVVKGRGFIRGFICAALLVGRQDGFVYVLLCAVGVCGLVLYGLLFGVLMICEAFVFASTLETHFLTALQLAVACPGVPWVDAFWCLAPGMTLFVTCCLRRPDLCVRAGSVAMQLFRLAARFIQYTASVVHPPASLAAQMVTHSLYSCLVLVIVSLQFFDIVSMLQLFYSQPRDMEKELDACVHQARICSSALGCVMSAHMLQIARGMCAAWRREARDIERFEPRIWAICCAYAFLCDLFILADPLSAIVDQPGVPCLAALWSVSVLALGILTNREAFMGCWLRMQLRSGNYTFMNADSSARDALRERLLVV